MRLIPSWLIFNLLLTIAISSEQDPAEELASFEVAEGFEVNLFASEKDGVVKPIQIRFDARGRIWVIGSTVYPQLEPGQVPNDKILILEDTDGDGRCDKTTVFADGLMIPTGIELGDGGVYLGHGNELLFLRDVDGDDRADERKVVLRGFGTGDNHQNINSFLFGPGGELWMCQGLHIFSSVETPWGIVRLEKAGLWRFRPLLRKLEGFYGSEHEPQNPWGYVFTKWGEPIVIAGNNSSMIYPVPGLTSSRRDLPPPLIWKKGQGRKSSGADIVETAHFPEEWQGLLITGGYINNAVWVLRIDEDGSGFALEDLPPLIKSSHRAFRPVDVKFGPDGALYICDWYNPIIGHYQASFRHPDRDKNHGRIWRVTAKGRALTPPPNLVDASTEQLIANLNKADGWTRRFAKRVLSERPREQVLQAARKRLTAGSLHPLEYKELLGVFQSHESVEEELLVKMSESSEPGVRAYAAQVTGLWAARLSQPLRLIEKYVRDPHPRVRLQGIVAATYVPSPKSIALCLQALDYSVDRFIDYALHQAVHSIKPAWAPALQEGELQIPNPAHLSFLVKSDGSPDTLQLLRNLLSRTDLPQSTRDTLKFTLLDTGTAADFAALLQQAAECTPLLLDRMRETSRVRGVRPAGDPSRLLQPFISSAPATQAASIRLAGEWKVQEYLSMISRKAEDPKEALLVRKAAIDALGSYGTPETNEQLARLTAGEGEIAAAAVVALTRNDLLLAGRKAAMLAGKKAEIDWQSVIAAFLQRSSGGATLARELQATASHQVAEAGLLVMNTSGRKDADLAELFAKVLGNEETTQYDSADFLEEVRAKGNPANGAMVYRRPELGCAHCHSVYGEGGNLGPDLSALGTAQPIDFIIGAILEPQKEVKEGYTSIAVFMKNGDEHQGYLVRESGTELVIRDILLGQEITLAVKEIASRQNSGSIMPAGLVDSLSREDFRDLVRFLSELGKQ